VKSEEIFLINFRRKINTGIQYLHQVVLKTCKIPQVRKDKGEKKQLQCESGRNMEQAFKRNQRSKKCAAVQKIAEEQVEIIGGGEKIVQHNSMKYRARY
jgi:hypothetical protein